MKKLCLECYKELHRSEFSEMYTISAEKEICEHCGEERYIVEKENNGYFVIH